MSKRRERKTGITSQEQELWDHARASMTPLSKPKARVLDGADEALFEAAFLRVSARTKATTPSLPGLPRAVPPAQTPGRKGPAPDLAAFDRKSARRIRTGAIEIDARIDLHGMHQAEAHAALRRFLLSGYRKGARWVLVITGKGAPRTTGWFARETNAANAFLPGHLRDEPKGVLRRNVPRWLAEPELRAIVVSFTEAAIQHGGEGALYVHLRRSGG